MSVWATPADVARLWPDAAVVDPATLDDLIGAATRVCQTFADPAVGEDPTPPATLDPTVASTRRLAVALEAREVWSASRRDGDVIGFDTYAVRVRPLSSTVQALLRPSRGRPVTG